MAHQAPISALFTPVWRKLNIRKIPMNPAHQMALRKKLRRINSTAKTKHDPASLKAFSPSEIIRTIYWCHHVMPVLHVSLF